MSFTFNFYAILLLFFGSISTALAVFIYRKGGKALRWFSLMMLSNAVWTTGYGFELASGSIEQAMLIVNLEYFGITALPLLWFLFCLHFSGREHWYQNWRNRLLILAIPFLTLILVWTNPYHHWHYVSYKMDTSGPFPIVFSTPGIWYYLFTIYFYLLLASGCYLLFIKFKTSDPVFRKQNYSLIIAALIPWLANMLYLMGLRPFGHLDITPFAFSLTSLLILFGIYRFKLFEIVPLAREKVLDLVQDGFIVLDSDHRIVDYNEASRNYIHFKEKTKIIGSYIDEHFSHQPDFIQMIKAHSGGKMEIEVKQNNTVFYLEAEIILLNDNKIHPDFTIIKLLDLTNYKKEVIRSREQATELERLNQLKDRIFSIIAHDLRGPMVNLSEILKMIASKQISDEEFKALAPSLSKDITYTTDLLENILHWSRSQLKGYGINKEIFNLRNLILNEIHYHQPAADLKNIKIIHDVFPGEMAYADMLMMQIVIRNIINNAIKFCREGCEIQITAFYQKENNLLVCIEDNGVGMPEETLDKLFKEENISTRGTSDEKGTGLGLLVCKDFMKRNDGDIHVTSSVGKGTKVCITIPVAPVS